MTSLPAISTALPALGSMRRTSSIVPGGGGAQPSSGSFSNSNHVASPLARSSSVRQEPASPHQQQPLQQQQPAVAPTAMSTSKRGSVSGPALESADDIEMHHVVGLIKSRNLDAFRSWVKEAATVNIKDFAGNTALHWACHKGLPEFVAVLLRRTADKNLTNNNGATPLHCAAIAGIKSVADLLIQAGADPMRRNAQGKNFFEVVRSKGHTHLEHAYEDLEYKLIADMNASVHCPTDSWLDANRLGAESDASESEVISDAGASPALPPVYGNKGRELAQAQRRASSHRASIAAGEALPEGGGASTGSHPRPQQQASNDSELERRIRALEQHHQHGQQTTRSSGSLARQGVSPQHPMLELDASTSSLHGGQNVTIPLVASPGGGATVDGSPSHPYSNRHTVPSVGGPSKGSAPYHSLPLQQLSQSATPRQAATVSPQRYVGPSGRILCSNCDPESRATATGYCEECRRNGDVCWYCDACWTSEHTSKRTRQHRKGPVPIPQSTLSNASLTPRSHFGDHGHMHDLFPFDVSALGPEARAYLMLQQQLLTAFTAAHGQQPPGAPLGRTAETERASMATQTMEPLQSAYFDEAMVELQDVREQLEAEVLHSQVLIDSTRVQLLEALELRHRGEIEAICWRKLLTIKRPPQVIVVHDPTFIPGTYEGLPRQRAGAAADAEWKKKQRPSQPLAGAMVGGDGSTAFLRSMSPPNVHTTSPPVRKRNATNSQAIQCVLQPPCAHAAAQTDHVGHDAAPEKQTDGAAYPRYAEDAVDVVHGEKHLPDQPQMLLVRWTRGGLESWVPAYEVAHCTAVVAYLTKYDKSLGNSQLLQLTGDELLELQRVCSPMNDSERTQLSQQLAELKRAGTANGSRESLDQPQQGTRAADDAKPKRPRRGPGKPPLATPLSPITKGDVLPASFQPASRGNMPLDDEDMPLPPCGERQNDDLEDPTPIPATPSDEDLVRKYEERLKELEVKQDHIKRLREEQAVRLVELKNKQKLVDVQSRADVHRQYEAKASLLQESQPEKLHPMASTTDRHAALVLQELQQEVLDAERHKTKKVAGAAVPTGRTGGQRPEPQAVNYAKKPPPPPPLLVPSSAQAPQQPAPQRTSTGQSGDNVPSSTGAGGQPTGPAGVPGEPSFEQKINRILYEQYFYNKAHPADAGGRGRAVSPTTAARQDATDPFRPASLN